jgi:hypothetical protein
MILTEEEKRFLYLTTLSNSFTQHMQTHQQKYPHEEITARRFSTYYYYAASAAREILKQVHLDEIETFKKELKE